MKEREERGWRRVEEIHHARENLFYDRVHPYRTQLLFVYRAEWVGLLEGGVVVGVVLAIGSNFFTIKRSSKRR